MDSFDKIACVGKNYPDHAKELGESQPDKPVIFIKPPSVLVAAKQNGERLDLPFPANRGSLHHECEIVLKLGKLPAQDRPLTLEEAERAIDSVTVGLDMTLRDEQGALKKKGHPWTIAKVFRGAAVVGPWHSTKEFVTWKAEPFRFELDGKVRQQSSADQMLFSPAACIAHLSEYLPLRAGDLIYTGTPVGVGPVQPGAVAHLSWGAIRYEVSWS